MVAPRPALLPLLRSENQLRVLATVMLQPKRSFTVTELSREAGVAQATVSREVGNLLSVGIFVASADRGRRVVRANTASSIYPELASILLKTTGPKAVLEAALSGLEGVRGATIYGSWARRYAGQPGPEPEDIDVVVIGTPDVRELHRRFEAASEQIGRDVNSSVLTVEEWEAADTGFLRQVRDSPLVELDLDSPADSSRAP